MKVTETANYKTVEFSDNEIFEGKDLNFENALIFNDLDYEVIEEGVIKVYNPNRRN